MNFKFEKIIVWQKAMDFGELVYEIFLKLPDEERFNLATQTIRAADSIALNIAEGAIGQSNAEFKRFIGYSIRSLAEVITCLHKMKRRKYIGDVVFANLYKMAYDLMNMLTAFRKSIK